MDRKRAEEIVLRCEEPAIQELVFLTTTAKNFLAGQITLKEYDRIIREKGVSTPMNRAFELGRLYEECRKCPCPGCSGGWHPPSKVKGQFEDLGRECETCKGTGRITS